MVIESKAWQIFTPLYITLSSKTQVFFDNNAFDTVFPKLATTATIFHLPRECSKQGFYSHDAVPQHALCRSHSICIFYMRCHAPHNNFHSQPWPWLLFFSLLKGRKEFYRDLDLSPVCSITEIDSGSSLAYSSSNFLTHAILYACSFIRKVYATTPMLSVAILSVK